MSQGDRRYNSQRWRRASKTAIANAGGRCQMQRQGCTGTATTCNHITSPLEATTPAENDRLFWSPLNHEAACRHCNSSHGATYGNRRRRLARYTPSRDW